MTGNLLMTTGHAELFHTKYGEFRVYIGDTEHEFLTLEDAITFMQVI